MRRWRVAGGVVERGGDVLLVRNRRRHGGEDWSTPGGVVDPGEAPLEALTREVAEETGLAVPAWVGPVYVVEAVAPDMGWHLEAEVYAARHEVGELRVADPDGIVVEARWSSVATCRSLLTTAPRWVAEPLNEFLLGDRSDTPRFRYRVLGTPPGLAVERMDAVPER